MNKHVDKILKLTLILLSIDWWEHQDCRNDPSFRSFNHQIIWLIASQCIDQSPWSKLWLSSFGLSFLNTSREPHSERTSICPPCLAGARTRPLKSGDSFELHVDPHNSLLCQPPRQSLEIWVGQPNWNSCWEWRKRPGRPSQFSWPQRSAPRLQQAMSFRVQGSSVFAATGCLMSSGFWPK